MNKKPLLRALLAMPVFLLLNGCVSVPPEVAQAHQKELEIIESLKSSHFHLVDAYIDSKVIAFDKFYFEEYGPVYLRKWKKEFMDAKKRDYVEQKDFALFYSDLVAEYEDVSSGFGNIRHELKQSIKAEYANAIEIHNATNNWIKSVQSLQAANKAVINQILGGIKSGLTLDAVFSDGDDKINSMAEEVKNRKEDIDSKYAIQ